MTPIIEDADVRGKAVGGGFVTAVYLGLGSNLGDRADFIEAAVALLESRNVLREIRMSRLFETDAVADDPQPAYVNAVVGARTSLPAEALLASCLAIETDLGRVRPVGRPKAARTIDIDLLLYGSQVIDTATLHVPHPAMLERAFVLAPLADVAVPGLVHPVTGTPLTSGGTASPSPSPWPSLRPAAPPVRLYVRRPGNNIRRQGGPMSSGQSGDAGSPPPEQPERRQAERIPLEMWVEETTDNERYFRRAGNLSRGGLRLDHTIPLPQGTVVHLTFTLPGEATPVALSGEIVANAGPDDLRMGVKFVTVAPAAQAQIDAYLARVGVSI